MSEYVRQTFYAVAVDILNGLDSCFLHNAGRSDPRSDFPDPWRRALRDPCRSRPVPLKRGIVMTHCGLDFGTSNSVIAHAGNGEATLVELEPGDGTMPSALFFDDELTETVIGSEAIERYLGGVEGRLMRALKSVLGSDLMDGRTRVHGHNVPFKTILTGFQRQLRRLAEASLGHELTQVVHGRPVHFHNRNPDADDRAAKALEQIAHDAGYRDVVFLFEPLAAAAAYEATIARETLVMVADLGGGTSDFSISRLAPDRRNKIDRSADILATSGMRLGGTDLDRLLSIAEVMPHLGLGSQLKDPRLTAPKWIYHKLATWSEINQLYAPDVRQDLRWLEINAGGNPQIDRLVTVIAGRHGHRLAAEVEKAKITLSSVESTDIAARFAGFDDPIVVTRRQRDAAYGEAMAQLTSTATACIDSAGIAPDQLDAILFTGGTSYMGLVRQALQCAAPAAEALAFDQMGAVARGLALTAERVFR